jgi:hypothetical protein
MRGGRRQGQAQADRFLPRPVNYQGEAAKGQERQFNQAERDRPDDLSP